MVIWPKTIEQTHIPEFDQKAEYWSTLIPLMDFADPSVV